MRFLVWCVFSVHSVASILGQITASHKYCSDNYFELVLSPLASKIKMSMCPRARWWTQWRMCSQQRSLACHASGRRFRRRWLLLDEHVAWYHVGLCRGPSTSASPAALPLWTGRRYKLVCVKRLWTGRHYKLVCVKPISPVMSAVLV